LVTRFTCVQLATPNRCARPGRGNNRRAAIPLWQYFLRFGTRRSSAAPTIHPVSPRHIDGGTGNDELHGAGGKDTLIGKDGNDRLFGEAGDDFLDAKDGITDLVLDGGSGFDKARKDSSDPATNIEQFLA
jgi:hypothetical protein